MSALHPRSRWLRQGRAPPGPGAAAADPASDPGLSRDVSDRQNVAIGSPFLADHRGYHGD